MICIYVPGFLFILYCWGLTWKDKQKNPPLWVLGLNLLKIPTPLYLGTSQHWSQGCLLGRASRDSRTAKGSPQNREINHNLFSSPFSCEELCQVSFCSIKIWKKCKKHFFVNSLVFFLCILHSRAFCHLTCSLYRRTGALLYWYVFTVLHWDNPLLICSRGLLGSLQCA